MRFCVFILTTFLIAAEPNTAPNGCPAADAENLNGIICRIIRTCNIAPEVMSFTPRENLNSSPDNGYGLRVLFSAPVNDNNTMGYLITFWDWVPNESRFRLRQAQNPPTNNDDILRVHFNDNGTFAGGRFRASTQTMNQGTSLTSLTNLGDSVQTISCTNCHNRRGADFRRSLAPLNPNLSAIAQDIAESTGNVANANLIEEKLRNPRATFRHNWAVSAAGAP